MKECRRSDPIRSDPVTRAFRPVTYMIRLPRRSRRLVQESFSLHGFVVVASLDLVERCMSIVVVVVVVVVVLVVVVLVVVVV